MNLGSSACHWVMVFMLQLGEAPTLELQQGSLASS